MLKQIIYLIPGCQLGDINIKETLESLKKKGYVFDPTDKLYKKNDLVAMVVRGRVKKIWYFGQMDLLVYEGKKISSCMSVEGLKKKFRNCKEINGSGGLIINCEDGGLGIITAHPENSIIAIFVQ